MPELTKTSNDKITDTLIKLIEDGTVKDIRDAKALCTNTKPLTDASTSISEKPLVKEEIDHFKQYTNHRYYFKIAMSQLERKRYEEMKAGSVKTVSNMIKAIQSSYPLLTQAKIKEAVREILDGDVNSGIGEVRNG